MQNTEKHHSVLERSAYISNHLLSTTQNRFLDAEGAAVLLGGLNTRTIVRWAREGYLPAYPIGEGKRRLWRFLAHDLENWMLSRRTGPSGFLVSTGPDTLTPATDAPTKGGFIH